MDRRHFLAAATAAGLRAGPLARGSSQTPSTMRTTVRRSADRGRAEHGWLSSRHTFSFAEYYDERFMGFRSLRVINQDRVAPGAGFPTHPHRDMEIFSYVLGGRIQHRDSMGNGRVLLPGEIQLMSAGRGVTHSEFNPRADEELHFLQIWIQPAERGLAPSYTEWKPEAARGNDAKVLVISPDGRDGSALIHQDALVYRVKLEAGQTLTHSLAQGRGAWLQVISGQARIDAQQVEPGDGASTTTAGAWTLEASTPLEALLFDLA